MNYGSKDDAYVESRPCSLYLSAIFSFGFLFWLSTHLVHSNADNNVTKMSTNYWNIYSFNMHTQPCLPVYRLKEQGL